MNRFLLFTFLLFAGAAHGQVTFVFHIDETGTANDELGPAGLAFDGKAGSEDYTQANITLTAEAYLDGVSASTLLNGSDGDGFGVNATGADKSTTRFDNKAGIESIVFTFNTAGTFDSLDLRYFTSDDGATLIFDGGSTYNITSVTLTSGNVFAVDEDFTSGQEITLQIASGLTGEQDFALESLTISAVPEPSSLAALLGLGALGFVATRRRGKKSQPAGVA